EGVVVCGARFNEEALLQATRLRVVSNVGVGYDNIDVAACTRRRIPVTNTAGVLEETTADLAFALLMAVARRVVEGDRYVREARWKQWEWTLLWGADIHHKTLGIYGFGRIGQAMARRGRGFSMRILYHSRHPAPEAVEQELRARCVNRETLLGESDFLSLHVPLTPETHLLITARELRLMKPSAQRGESRNLFLEEPLRSSGHVSRMGICPSLDHDHPISSRRSTFLRAREAPRAADFP